MKRKIATLHVYVNDEADGSHIGTQWTRDEKGEMVSRTGEWELELGGKDDLTSDFLGTFAHELGHFASQVLRTPAAMRDLHNCAKAKWCAYQMEKQFGVPRETFGEKPWHHIPEAVVSKYAAESEAWDIARSMGVPINEGEAEKCLDTYREGVRRVERGEILVRV